MADAAFSSLQLNQIHGNHGSHHLRGFATDDHDQTVSATQGKQDHPNNKNPWLAAASDRAHRQNLLSTLHSVDGLKHHPPVQHHMTGNKDHPLGEDTKQPPPPTTFAPPTPTSSLQWMLNDIQPANTSSKNMADVPSRPSLLFESSRKPMKEKSNSITLDSLELLTNYGKGTVKNFNDPELSMNPIINDQIRQREPNKLSLGEIVRMAGERYLQVSTRKDDGFTMLKNPHKKAATNLSVEESTDVELVQLLLASAETVSHRQFDIAGLLISRCQWIASDSGNSAQRLVFYFAEALQRRIDMETGRTTDERMYERATYARRLEVDFNFSFLACHQAVPFSQASQFAAVQAILENVKTANKIHVVDLHIRSGIQWTVLMQALSEREELPTLKISALATTNKQHMEETGNRLRSFAESLNLNFTFNVVSVTEMKQLREEMFQKEADEAVAVYSAIILRTLITDPDNLGYLMKIMKRLRPSIVVVTEVEANHNSPSFVSRFTESLLFYGAFFDSLGDCMDRDNQHRKIIEGIYLGEGIRNIVGSEGDKRCTRNVKLDVWREFFAWYGMAEVELSQSALRQAHMILNKFPKPDSCNITPNGKGIIIGWKGTPIHSLTTWKFS